MKFRQATYEEFKDLMRKAIMHEYEHYRPHVPTERREWMRDNQPDFLWNIEGRDSVAGNIKMEDAVARIKKAYEKSKEQE